MRLTDDTCKSLSGWLYFFSEHITHPRTLKHSHIHKPTHTIRYSHTRISSSRISSSPTTPLKPLTSHQIQPQHHLNQVCTAQSRSDLSGSETHHIMRSPSGGVRNLHRKICNVSLRFCFCYFRSVLSCDKIPYDFIISLIQHFSVSDHEISVL